MKNFNPAVAVLSPEIDPGPRVRRVALDRLMWPLGRPDRLRQGVVADMSALDHLIVLPCSVFGWWPDSWVGRGVQAQLSVLMAEPAEIQRSLHRRIVRMAGQFHTVLTYDDVLLNQVPNGVFFPYGSTWITNPKALSQTKTRMCSLIASCKRSQTGHRLRHSVADWLKTTQLDVDLLGRGYKPFLDKSEGLAPYRYSVVIENVRARHCFTEKLIDAVLCDCVPIYWGCPNITDFMDTSGMILCKSQADVQTALHSMSEADYAARLPALRKARPGAEAYADIFGRAAQAAMNGRPVPPTHAWEPESVLA